MTTLRAICIVFVLAGGVQAANNHYQGKLICSDCHVTHSSLRHDYQGPAEPWTDIPNKHLLKSASNSDICLQCHDNRPGIPDVVGEDINNPSEKHDGSERAAGRFAEGNVDNWRGHNLPGQGESDPGGCVACHDPHGNTNYRNLRSLSGLRGPVALINPEATGLNRYRRSNIRYLGSIEMLCGGCHENGAASGIRTGDIRSHRHPSTGNGSIARIGDGTRTAPDHWISGKGSGFDSGVPRVPFAMTYATNFATATSVSRDNEVFCLSCHKAHGSVNAFGLQWPYGTRDGQVSNSGCNQCHNVSGS